jgi:hypothetical protein
MQRQGRTVFVPAGADRNQTPALVSRFVKNLIFYAVVVGFLIALYFVERDWTQKQEAVHHVPFVCLALCLVILC